MVVSHGALAPHMIASAAIPILYKPVNIGDRYYYDGAPVVVLALELPWSYTKRGARPMDYSSQKVEALPCLYLQALLSTHAAATGAC